MKEISEPKSALPSFVSPVVILACKARWFELAAQEKYPHTPDISRELDTLQTAIRAAEASLAH